MEQKLPDKCFAIMPFGTKKLGDGSGRDYDFDKVYRVIIQQAIRADDRFTATSESVDIGRRQYMLLRRFIVHYLNVLRIPALIGQVSRSFQTGSTG